MEQFYVCEKDHLNVISKGQWIQAKNLSSAKRKASQLKALQGTILTISYEDTSMSPGISKLVSYKKSGENWHDVTTEEVFAAEDQEHYDQ